MKINQRISRLFNTVIILRKNTNRLSKHYIKPFIIINYEFKLCHNNIIINNKINQV